MKLLSDEIVVEVKLKKEGWSSLPGYFLQRYEILFFTCKNFMMIFC